MRASPRTFGIAAALLITAGTFFSIRLHTVYDSRIQLWRNIDHRYREVLAALPARGPLLYVSDHEPRDWWITWRLHAQYAVAPRLLVDSGPAEVALADVRDPKSIERLAPGFERVAGSKDGRIVLLRKVAK